MSSSGSEYLKSLMTIVSAIRRFSEFYEGDTSRGDFRFVMHPLRDPFGEYAMNICGRLLYMRLIEVWESLLGLL
jgi:hypothetical protein